MQTRVDLDPISTCAAQLFDLKTTGLIEFPVITFEQNDLEFANTTPFGIIVGPSGSGKTTCARYNWPSAMIFTPSIYSWSDSASVVSYFRDIDIAIALLSAVGFNSIPSWMKPFFALSNGEQYRVALARLILDCLESPVPLTVIVDEFTSVLDRNTAVSLSYSLCRYFEANPTKTRFIFLTCHYDILAPLQPYWTFFTPGRCFYRIARQLESEIIFGLPDDPRCCTISPNFASHFELTPSPVSSPVELLYRVSFPEDKKHKPPAIISFPRSKIILTVRRVSYAMFSLFAPHHYLSSDIAHATRCYLFEHNNIPVGFSATMTMQSRYILNAFRGHRTVVLPEFQGLGIGVRIGDYMGAYLKALGWSYYSRTAHPRMGRYRNNRTELWKATSRNGKNQHAKYRDSDVKVEDPRICFSHQYVGPPLEGIIPN